MAKELENKTESTDKNCDGLIDKVNLKIETTRFVKKKRKVSESFTRLEAFLNTDDAKRYLREEKK